MKKGYIFVNITLLILAIYVIFFPFISLVLERINPTLTQCVYLKITGKECPLCGGTRYIKNFGTVITDITYLFNFFGIIILTIIFNIIFRIVNIILIKKNKDIKNIMIFDYILHGILLILFIGYEIIFIMNT